MKVQPVPFWDVVYVAVLIAAIPLTVFHLTYGLYAQAVMAGGSAVIGGAILMSQWLQARSESLATRPEMVDHVPRTAAPATVRVVSVENACPLGYEKGTLWLIGPDGQISPSLCRPAMTAICPLLVSFPNAQERRASCHCPHGKGELGFAVRPAAIAA